MENQDLKKLATKIRETRLSKNLTQEELAHKCNFDRTYISMLERAKRNPSYLNLLKLCEGLELQIHELLKGEK
ncbi:helix-turn-helix domain-containing protein [Aliarcobacter cryaerophilus]|uniref:helix-turn-helix domain-containing protein n=1 Tax=Aliarcobacter cryaerophilus TaxID=28198 RepID=UPI000EB00952|nr:helix-turn-helix transcriptional regulator [Aliarcobacter cryaerophilus]AYJ78192.1 putative restriction-modification system transcriptional control element [Aliarcobacter cryaerophilus D2610]